MSALFTLEAIEDLCTAARSNPTRSGFEREAKARSARLGLGESEAAALARTLASSLGLVDADDRLDEEPIPSMRKARPARAAITEGLVWGLLCLLGATTVLGIGSDVIERLGSASSMVAECSASSCFEP